MKKIIAVVLLFVSVVSLNAQDSKIKVSAGAELSIPTYTEIHSAGVGGSINMDYRISQRVSGLITIGFNHFNGRIIDHFNSDTILGFSVMPVMAGFRYYIAGNFYTSGQAGLVIGLKHAGNSLALSPAIGVLLPVNGAKKIDVGLKFTGVMRQTSFPENNFLNRGGYSFLSARIGYSF